MLLAGERGRVGERYILGNQNITLKEMLDLLAEITGLPAPRVRMPYAAAWLAVGIENDATSAVVHQSDRQGHLQLASARLVQDAALQARLQNMQFCFAHRSLQAQQKAVIEVRRVVDSVLIEDERAR